MSKRYMGSISDKEGNIVHFKVKIVSSTLEKLGLDLILVKEKNEKKLI